MGVDTLSLNIPNSQTGYTGSSGTASFGSAGISNPSLPTSYKTSSNEYASQTDTANRLVVQESNLSLLVKNVVDVRNRILEFTKSKGGYMVSSSVSNPQDAPTSTVIVRIPSAKLQEALDYFHSLSIKVVSENLYGTDVTDQYVDIETRIAQLERTKTRLESLLDQASQITEITNLTQQVLNYQNQIDNLKGQQQSLEKNAELSKLTIYLSTDEIALPYAPSETFRPGFKLAVRSLVRSLRGLATMAIWLLVYSVIWLPALVLVIIIKRWNNKRKLSSQLTPAQKSEK